MKFPVTHESYKTFLLAGNYRVYILGGFYFKADSSFLVRIINCSGKEKPIIHQTLLKIRAYSFGRRAVQVFDFEIMSSGEYEFKVLFNDLIVRKSNLLISKWLQEPLSLNEIEIGIERIN
jgi:hypothetical protein